MSFSPSSFAVPAISEGSSRASTSYHEAHAFLVAASKDEEMDAPREQPRGEIPRVRGAPARDDGWSGAPSPGRVLLRVPAVVERGGGDRRRRARADLAVPFRHGHIGPGAPGRRGRARRGTGGRGPARA